MNQGRYSLRVLLFVLLLFLIYRRIHLYFYVFCCYFCYFHCYCCWSCFRGIKAIDVVKVTIGVFCWYSRFCFQIQQDLHPCALVVVVVAMIALVAGR